MGSVRMAEERLPGGRFGKGCRIGLREATGSRWTERSEEGIPGRTGNLSRPKAHPRKGKSGCEELS